MRKALLTAALLLCAPAVAQADVTYTFTGQIYGGESVARGATLDFTLVVTDAALARGTFQLTEQTGPIATSGDVADFVSFNFTVGPSDGGFFTPTSGSVPGSLQVNLRLGEDFASGSLTALNATSHFSLSSVFGSTLVGESDSDANNCNDPQGVSRCTVLGNLVRVQATTVPEPASLALLGAGLLGLAAVRRRA